MLVVLSGPSGVGKDAVVSLMQHRLQHDKNFHFTITATTRHMRPGESDGVDYVFLSRSDFKGLLRRGELLEHAEVYGNFYGIPKGQVRQALSLEKDVILKIDVQGAATIRSLAPDSVCIFLAPPDLETLKHRLTKRMTESQEVLTTRLEISETEMKESKKFDHIVVNRSGRLAETADEILQIMERERVSGKPRHYDI